MSNSEWNDAEANVLPEKVASMRKAGDLPQNPDRKRIVVVGLGMVGIAFMYAGSLYNTSRYIYSDFDIT